MIGAQHSTACHILVGNWGTAWHSMACNWGTAGHSMVGQSDWVKQRTAW